MYNFAGKINVYDYEVIAPIHRWVHDIQHMHHINLLNPQNFLLLRCICHDGFQIRSYRVVWRMQRRMDYFKEQRSQFGKV